MGVKGGGGVPGLMTAEPTCLLSTVPVLISTEKSPDSLYSLGHQCHSDLLSILQPKSSFLNCQSMKFLFRNDSLLPPG